MPTQDQKQIESARALVRELSDTLDLDAFVRLWDGSRLPLGQNAKGPFEIAIRDPGVIGAILRKPSLDTMIQQYVAKGIDFEGGTLVDFGRELQKDGKSVKLKVKDIARLGLKLAPFMFAKSGPAQDAHGFEGDITGQKRRDRRQQGLHPVPLRSFERFLRPLSRPRDGLLLRLLHGLVQHGRTGAARQARNDLPEIALKARRQDARHRLGLGRPRLSRGAELRRQGARLHVVGGTARLRAREGEAARD